MTNTPALEEAIKQIHEGQGKSDGAMQRRAKRRQLSGKLHSGKPGQKIRIGAATYRVAKDGSFRRQ